MPNECEPGGMAMGSPAPPPPGISYRMTTTLASRRTSAHRYSWTAPPGLIFRSTTVAPRLSAVAPSGVCLRPIYIVSVQNEGVRHGVCEHHLRKAGCDRH